MANMRRIQWRGGPFPAPTTCVVGCILSPLAACFGDRGRRWPLARKNSLAAEGNRELEHYSQKWFESKMQNWETTINHYLSTGKKMAA